MKSGDICCVVVALALGWFPTLTTAGDDSPPNILFIAVDDLRCELGCYGVSGVHSPNFDRLARSGVLFTRAYCQQAVCNPSRVSVMTGLRPDSTRVWDLKTDFRTTIPEAVTLPQHLRRHGYRAVSYGKIFHNPFPDQVSWDEPHRWPEEAQLWSAAAREELAETRQRLRDEGVPEAAIQRLRARALEQVDVEDSQHVDGAIAEQGIAAMQRLSQGDQPFFLAVGFVRPHLPFVVPTKYWDQYRPDEISLAENQFLPRGSPAVAFGDRSQGGFYELRDYLDFRTAPSPFKRPLAAARQRELKHGYYAAVSFIDAQLGRLLDELDRLDLTNKTVVVLWSDHGWKLGEHGGWCKQTNYEIDTRSPLMIRAPRARGNGGACSALVEFVDIYPTVCDLAGVPVPDILEGHSLRPLLNDPDSPGRDAAFSQFPRTHKGRDSMGYAMRTDQYRYVEWIDTETGETIASELYDHERDAGENDNLAGDESRSAAVREHSSRLRTQFDLDVYRDVKRLSP